MEKEVERILREFDELVVKIDKLEEEDNLLINNIEKNEF